MWSKPARDISGGRKVCTLTGQAEAFTLPSEQWDIIGELRARETVTGPCSREDLVGLEWGPRICISKYPGSGASPGPHSENAGFT